MRSTSSLFDEVWRFAALLQAWRQAARGKRRRADVCSFEGDLAGNLLGLSARLLGGSWRPGGYRTFAVEENGKRRLISAAPFEDRVVHHAIVNAVEPLWERRFVGWTFANRRGLGTHLAMRHAARGVRRHRHFLQLDVERFFPSINHRVLKELIHREVRDARLNALIGLVIDSGAGILASEWKPTLFPGDDLLSLARPKGLPIGNQTSQFFANVMLHPLDLAIAHRVRPGLAARYVDDLVLFDDDLEKLRAARAFLEGEAARLRLRFNPRKTRLAQTNGGLTFVGYRITPAQVRLPRKTVGRFRSRLAELQRAYAGGEVTLAGVRQSIAGLLGHAGQADAEELMRRLLEEHPFVRSTR